ncbi:MAG TPA: hypothetical protein VGO35_06380 [Gammaproteobacteria bacterium]|mgnify:CR=1 FL=1|jgi:hypothetical protein|nr:hypothetical protein [Gammaproteobacteria bacterium]
MTKLLLTCSLMVALTACATSQPVSTTATTGSGGAALGSAVTAAPSAQTVASASTAVKPQQAKLVCDDEEQIGSHFHARVCLTPEQVAARKKAAQLMMLNHNGGNGGCANSSCPSMGAGGPPRR